MIPTKLKIINSIKPKLKKLTNPCTLCMHKCNVNRFDDKKGLCKSTSKMSIFSYGPHHGEEPPLSGVNGSGTIFFANCNMDCCYCQNYRFSHASEECASEDNVESLARKMLKLSQQGCHNINLVSPTHYLYWIVGAIENAIKNSFQLPIVYNTGGYDTLKAIKLLDGIVDVYLQDMRYSSSEMAKKFSSAPKYVENNRSLVKEMFRQKGELEVDEDGIATGGVIVRLLILPQGASGVIDTLRFLKEEVSTKIYLSVMSQYYPTYKAQELPQINRTISKEEYDEVVEAVNDLGFQNGWIQGFKADTDHFLGTRIKRAGFESF